MIRFLLLFIIFVSPLMSEEMARIGILTKYSGSHAGIDLQDATLFTDEKVIEHRTGTVHLKADSSSLLIKGIHPDKTSHVIIRSNHPITIRTGKIKRSYSYSVEITNHDGKLRFVQILPVENYIRSVVMWEAGELLQLNQERIPEDKLEFFKAMSVAVRTYYYKNRHRHQNESYELCDLTHCMFYGGRIEMQIDIALKREVLTNRNRDLIDAYFHSTCGGNLTQPSVYWPDHKNTKAYRIGKDIYRGEILCSNSPHYRWSSFFSKQDMKLLLHGTENPVTVKKESRVTGLKYGPNYTPIHSFLSQSGRRFGWNRIKSNDFTLKKVSSGYHLQGRGLGHGVGMCQWGAARMSELGANYEEILKHYYPGAVLHELP